MPLTCDTFPSPANISLSARPGPPVPGSPALVVDGRSKALTQAPSNWLFQANALISWGRFSICFFSDCSCRRAGRRGSNTLYLRSGLP